MKETKNPLPEEQNHTRPPKTTGTHAAEAPGLEQMQMKIRRPQDSNGSKICTEAWTELTNPVPQQQGRLA
jgi:hypothetical protein